MPKDNNSRPFISGTPFGISENVFGLWNLLQGVLSVAIVYLVVTHDSCTSSPNLRSNSNDTGAEALNDLHALHDGIDTELRKLLAEVKKTEEEMKLHDEIETEMEEIKAELKDTEAIKAKMELANIGPDKNIAVSIAVSKKIAEAKKLLTEAYSAYVESYSGSAFSKDKALMAKEKLANATKMLKEANIALTADEDRNTEPPTEARQRRQRSATTETPTDAPTEPPTEAPTVPPTDA